MSKAPAKPNSHRRAPSRGTAGRRRADIAFYVLCLAVGAASTLILVTLLSAITWQGISWLSVGLLVRSPAATPEEAGIGPAIAGTIWVCGTCALFTLPIGVATAILLEEYRPKKRLFRWLHGLVQLNIANLAGVPSVVYGIIGLSVFVMMFGLFGSPLDPGIEFGARFYDQFVTVGDRPVFVPVASRRAPETVVAEGMKAYSGRGRVALHVIGPDDRPPDYEELRLRTVRSSAEQSRIARRSWYYFRLPLGRGVLAGAFTLMLVVLPIVIIASQEAIRAVPDSLREAAFGMGATRWQMVWNVSLPASIPGIMTGSILAMSRAIGEAAPILIVSGVVYISSIPGNLMDDFTVMPLQIFDLAGRPEAGFQNVAAAAIIVLLLMLLSFNAVAVWMRHRARKNQS